MCIEGSRQKAVGRGQKAEIRNQKSVGIVGDGAIHADGWELV